MSIRIYDNEIATLLHLLGQVEDDDLAEEERRFINTVRDRVQAADALELAGFTDKD